MAKSASCGTWMLISTDIPSYLGTDQTFSIVKAGLRYGDYKMHIFASFERLLE